MRNKIKEIFLNSGGSFLSGEELSKRLNISRAAIWKHIEELKKEGYHFDAVRKRGYRLLNLPDDIYPTGIKKNLKTAWLGNEIIYFKELESTQKTAHELARKEAKHGTIVISDEQFQGKGRLGRTWYSEQGKGIWMSIILRPNFTFHNAPLITLITSLIIVESLKELYGVSAKIKWPNDIYVNEKKLAGILTEIHGEQDILQYLIIGIGINIHSTIFPVELEHKATSLEEQINIKPFRIELIQMLLQNLEVAYDNFEKEGFKSFFDRYNELLLWKGKKINVTQLRNQLAGYFEGIDQDGLLIITKDNGERVKVYSGDLQL